MGFPVLENHMVLPDCMDNGYEPEYPEHQPDVCTWCECEILGVDLAVEEDAGWIHRACRDQRREEAQGASVLAFAGFIAAAYIVLFLFVHFGLKASGR